MGKPKFEQVTPILSVRDVDASIAYYLEKLGFEESWHWGHPTTFGGVSRDNIEILFCKERRVSRGLRKSQLSAQPAGS